MFSLQNPLHLIYSFNSYSLERADRVTLFVFENKLLFLDVCNLDFSFLSNAWKCTVRTQMSLFSVLFVWSVCFRLH